MRSPPTKKKKKDKKSSKKKEKEKDKKDKSNVKSGAKRGRRSILKSTRYGSGTPLLGGGVKIHKHAFEKVVYEMCIQLEGEDKHEAVRVVIVKLVENVQIVGSSALMLAPRTAQRNQLAA